MMGCSYYITCKKCESASRSLYDLDLDKVAETLQDDASFSLEDFNTNNIIDSDKLLTWLTKHKDHGEVFFDISC